MRVAPTDDLNGVGPRSVNTALFALLGSVQRVAAVAVRFAMAGGRIGRQTTVGPGRGVDDRLAAKSLEFEEELHLQVIAPQGGSGLDDEVHARRQEQSDPGDRKYYFVNYAGMRSGTVLSSCNSNSLAASRRSQSVICRCTSGSDVRRRSGRGEKGRRGRRPRATTPSGFGTRFPLRTAPGLGTQTGRTKSPEMHLSGALCWGSARPRSP